MGGLSKLFVEFWVVKKFMEKKGLGEYGKFPSENFVSQCRKVSQGKPPVFH